MEFIIFVAVEDNADDIDWEKLPKRFVLKCNHGCAYNIVISDKKCINIKKITQTWIKY